uniref:Ig-like domain-containing protein n=1 Tax=Setaria digitata TaxID=48799 RepID=A0A915PXA1_9BILA
MGRSNLKFHVSLLEAVPWVDSVYTYIPVRLDQDINLTCKYNAEPSPQVDWFYNGFTINVAIFSWQSVKYVHPSVIYCHCLRIELKMTDVHFCIDDNLRCASARDRLHARVAVQMTQDYALGGAVLETFTPDTIQSKNNYVEQNRELAVFLRDPAAFCLMQYAARRDNYSESILAIENIKEDNFGDYTCRVANNLGTKQKTIYVSGRPGPPQLNASGTRLSWSVHSVDPVIEYQILYRFSNDDTWQQFKSIRANKEEQNGDIWSRSEDLVWLRPGLEYELQMKARNTLGWGSLARSYVTVKTPPLDNVTNDSKHFISVNEVTILIRSS